MKFGSRGAGQSAAAHGAYIAREGKYAAKTLDDEAVLAEHGNLIWSLFSGRHEDQRA